MTAYMHGSLPVTSTEKNEKPPAPSKVIGDFSNHSTDLDSALLEADKEAFTTLASQFVPTGHALHCIEHSNTFYAERWGHVRDFATLDDARKFLVQIGGTQ